MAKIDLNCDLGEGGAHDAELLTLITSANIACGAHAGDPMTMMMTIMEAKRRNVRIGAHPGYFDREHFGRCEMVLSHDQMLTECVYQIGALKGIAECLEMRVSYIKPHGALYNQACHDSWPAVAVMGAARFFDVPLLGLPNSKMQEVSEPYRPFIREGFADRRYDADGLLLPRDKSGAFIETSEEAVEQAEWLIAKQNIRSLCVHGDNPDAVAFVRKLRERLTARGHEICPFT